MRQNVPLYTNNGHNKYTRRTIKNLHTTQVSILLIVLVRPRHNLINGTSRKNVRLCFRKWFPNVDKLHNTSQPRKYLSLYSLSGKTSYHQTSWSLEGARLDVIMIVSFWKLTGISKHGFRCACQISGRLKKSKPESRSFETSRDLASA